MKTVAKILFFVFVLLIYRQDEIRRIDELFTVFSIDVKSAKIEFYWKNDAGENFGSLSNLKKLAETEGKNLRFAMNGGMYQADGKPLGVFVQNGKLIAPLNLRHADGNFYLQPNGVFYLTDDNRALVVTTTDFQTAQAAQNIRFATQSGPMLVENGRINPIFTPDSQNLYIRNGVCVTEDSKIMFVISRRKVNFYNFAAYFKDSGCQNALYLDGFVSRMYAPELNITQTDGDFGVIIGIIE